MCSTLLPEERLSAALDSVEQTEPALCERPTRVADLARAASRLTGLYLRELGQVDASGELEAQGFATTVSWVRHETGRSDRDARADVTLARRLRQLPVIGQALIDGTLQPKTAELISRVALTLPEELVAETEPALVQAAQLMNPFELRRFLAEKVAALAPERLKDAIKSQYERRRMFLDPVGDMNELRASMEPLDAELLETTLNAIMESDRREDDDRPMTKRRYDAFQILVGLAVESPGMPKVRGALPHLVIVKEDDQPAHTLGGTVLSDGQLDGVACEARVTHVVVDSGRRPLDVGRSARSLSTRLWLAVVVRDDGHCQVAGCSVPASRCVPHHIVPWRLGGPTDLDNLVLICVAHHHALHDREIHLLLYDGRRLTPTGSMAPVGSPPTPHRQVA